MYAAVTRSAHTAGGARELVMDTELVAVDRAEGNRLKAFQELSTRARGQTEMHQVPFPFHPRTD